MAHDELIERSAARHQHRGGASAAPARHVRPAATWRQSCPDTRPSHRHRARRCRCRAPARWSTRRAYGTFTQPLLDLPPPLRQVAAAIAANLLAAPGRPSKSSLRYVVRISVVRRLCANTISCSLRFRNSAAIRRVSDEVRPADPELLIHHRRVDEDEELFAARRAALRRPARKARSTSVRPVRADWRSSPTSR